VGIQLIIYGSRPQTDLDGVLAECKAAGYAGIESGNLGPIYGAARLKEMFKQHGLIFTGVHTGYGEITDEAKLGENLALVKAIGGTYLICSGVADRTTIAGYDRSAETFNQAGAICREEGITFCYHNHAFEFEPLEGGDKGIHRLGEMTDSAVVKFNIDVYWVTVGGEDPAAFIRRYADRAGYYHFKDGAPGSFTELGKGTVNLKTSLEAALAAKGDWIIYEQDRTDQEAKVSIIESRQHLKALGV
jgi:sugar phosphate isomerase/epimerase